MDNDSFTEVSSQGWFSRIGDSIKGILFGLFLFIAAFPLLWWNEGRSVERYNSLKEGLSAVISVAATTIDPTNNGKLIHTQGLADTKEVLSDAVFNVSANALKLRRTVLMYQWQENVTTDTKEEIGGSTTTEKTYSYNKGWHGNKINSNNFKRSGHNNPAMPFTSKAFQAKQVSLHAFQLTAAQVSRINNQSELNVNDVTHPAQLAGKTMHSNGDGFYLGNTSGAPEIGDLKINFSIVLASNISLVAQQQQNSFSAYQTQAGGTIDLLKLGMMDAAAMFAAAQKENTLLTWGIRVGGFMLMWFGLSLIFKPLSVLGSVLPFLGNLISMGTGILAFLITLPCTMVTIALAWVAYRPLLAGGLIAVAVISIVAMKYMPRRKMIPTKA
ncbi:MAG: hypothetical protein GQ581_03085 [Methyloprofundus sp.]|nr:hypothetical protein [Methyloprofundus sp.]